MSFNIRFVSVWDDGVKICTDGEYNPDTKEISNIQVCDNVEELDILEQEYIELPNGERLEVCQDCHNHVLTSAMVKNNHDEHDESVSEVLLCTACEEE